MERIYRTCSDARLEQLLKETRVILEQLEDEQSLRRKEDKENAWANLVDEIKEFCKKYGPITVSGFDVGWGSTSIDIKFENIDASVVGFIETKIK